MKTLAEYNAEIIENLRSALRQIIVAYDCGHPTKAMCEMHDIAHEALYPTTRPL